MGGGKKFVGQCVWACVNTQHIRVNVRVCKLGGSGGMPPQKKIFFRSSQIASHAI